MKTNSTKIRNYKLFKYNLLKLQIYSNKFEKEGTFFYIKNTKELAFNVLISRYLLAIQTI